MIYLINTKTKEHIDAMTLGDAEYGRLAGSSGWIVQMADPDGWIPWVGGECPLPDGHLVDIRVRDGSMAFCVPANEIADAWPDASGCFWVHEDHDGDIIAYRPALESSAKVSHPGTLAGPDKFRAVGGEPPAWDGDVPPVGCECEVNGTPLHDGQDGWKRCEIIAHTDFGHGPIAVARVCDDTQCAWGTAGSFRPIRSEEDRTVDHMKSVAGTSYVKPEVMEMICRALYRAGYRKTAAADGE